MYNCECCTTPSKPNQKVTKITLYVVVNNRRQIKQELKVCPLCYEDYHKGIPLASLAAMHRPVSPQLTPASPAVGGSVGNFAKPTEPLAPLAGASLICGNRMYHDSKFKCSDEPGHRGSCSFDIPCEPLIPSPKEKRPPVLLGASKAEKLIELQEGGASKGPNRDGPITKKGQI